jgi:splicing factor 3B subunit 1
MSAIGHMALGVFAFSCEDALIHLLNYVWPNIFEASPHVIQAFMGAIEGMRVGLGAPRVLYYALQVIFFVFFKRIYFYLTTSIKF